MYQKATHLLRAYEKLKFENIWNKVLKFLLIIYITMIISSECFVKQGPGPKPSPYSDQRKINKLVHTRIDWIFHRSNIITYSWSFVMIFQQSFVVILLILVTSWPLTLLTLTLLGSTGSPSLYQLMVGCGTPWAEQVNRTVDTTGRFSLRGASLISGKAV